MGIQGEYSSNRHFHAIFIAYPARIAQRTKAVILRKHESISPYLELAKGRNNTAFFRQATQFSTNVGDPCMTQQTTPQHQQLMASLLGSGCHAIIATDGKGLITTMNRLAEKLTGVKKTASAGKPLGDIFHLMDHSTHAPVKFTTAVSFQKNCKEVCFNHAIFVSATGEETLVNAIFTPLKDSKGNIEGVVLIFRDISETVAGEDSIMNTQRMTAIGNIANSVAHNLNNWLSIISGHASSISDNLLPNTRAHEEAQKIINATKHAGGLAKRLLSIARASKMTGAVKTEQIDLADTVKHAIAMAEGSLVGQKIGFKVATLAKTPYVEANTDQLLDCLMNLFLNAADAMPNGGVISIDASNTTVRNKSFVVLRVRDTGTGMSKDVLAHIFEPFYALKDSGSTMRLGLTIVKSAIEQWGGFAKVESKPGHGTSFRLFIPKGATKSKEVKKPISTGGETILVVDDDAGTLTEIENILKDAGYKVLKATNGDDCISLFHARRKAIDLTIIDVVMPGKDGKSVLQKILKSDPTASIVMTSGFSRDYVRTYLERGIWGFIQKPIERHQLLAILRRILDEKTAGMKMAAADVAAS